VDKIKIVKDSSGEWRPEPPSADSTHGEYLSSAVSAVKKQLSENLPARAASVTAPLRTVIVSWPSGINLTPIDMTPLPIGDCSAPNCNRFVAPQAYIGCRLTWSHPVSVTAPLRTVRPSHLHKMRQLILITSS
jgi:hypothetical protein